MYKVSIYILSILISIFAVSGINFNNFFKKNYKYEAKIFIIIICLCLGYLLGNFIIEFIEISQII